MTAHMKAIDIDVPVRTAYNQWTQFESFPAFMDGVDAVDQLDAEHQRWQVEIGGVSREFVSKITEQEPDQRIAWRSTKGPNTAGVVTFHRMGERKSRVTLQMEFDPEGFLEQVGDKLGFVAHKVDGDLQRFKRFIESRGQESGAWREKLEQSATH